jgi:UDP-N-acetylmuramoyl-L-alanyl-D-glutamate--2,6-diaminopimelate ligase
LRVVGVTGTDGKTTTTNLIYHVLLAAGYRVGMISTVNAVIGQQAQDTGLHTTTPDAPDVQRYLAEMVAAGTDYAVLESTSHGLAQGRVIGCEFDVAVVTNITHEHLDYHGSYREYRRAKALLFRELQGAYRKPGTPKVAILNRDDSSFAYLRRIPADVRLSYGLSSQARVRADDVRCGADGISFTAIAPDDSFPLRSGLVGEYNVCNILAAVATALSQQVPPQAIVRGIAALRAIPGRMERVERGQPFTAIVDFAHTPFALRRTLQAARQLVSGRVIVVFGCAGLRDKVKRQMMGRIAAELADFTVITAEDPRTEDLEVIMAEIAAGCREGGGIEGRTCERVADRGEAIARAVALAGPGDVVIVCGKGHEQSMCFGTTEYPWDDRQALAAALEGAPLRTLPTARIY